MGLRTASARHPHVEIMAPALTEPNQTGNFKLSPETQSASPINGDSHGKATAECEESCHPQMRNDGNLNGSINKGAEVSHSISNLPRMSTALVSADEQDKMGVQKTGLDSVLNLLKDKQTPDVEQMLNSLDPGDISQNVDEIMQVITSMEGSTSNLQNNTNYIGNEPENILALFNEVDVINMSMEEPLIDGAISKETRAKDLTADVQKRQIKLERKLEFLLRRLRKTQMRNMGQHFSGEVGGIFEHVHRTLRRLKEGIPAQGEIVETSTMTLHSESSIISPDKMKPISSSSAKNLVKKLETSAVLQSNSIVRRHSAKYFGSGSTEPAIFRSGVSGMISLPTWASEHKLDFQRVSGLLHTEFSLVQEEVDSEATASSSGGESCDEMQNYNNMPQQYLSIHKRAAWKYAVERASIAARWTWLQAQISDLEYRIRQHGDLYKQIRSSKGLVKLGDESPTRSVPTSPSILNGYRGQLPGASPCATTTASAKGVDSLSVGDEAVYQCARARPLVNFRKRKLLQTTGLHAVSKKAARPATIRCGCVRPNVPCALCTGRTDPTHPRDPVEYLGKSERIAMLDPCFHPVFSLLEDCPTNIHLDAIMKTAEWQQRSSRSTIKSMKYIGKSDRIDKVGLPLNHRSKKLDQRRKYPQLLKSSSATNAMSPAIPETKSNRVKGRRNSSRHSSVARLNKKRHSSSRIAAQASIYAGCGEDEELENLASVSGLCSGKFGSPSTSPLLATQSISGFQRRNRVDSYDIDNIVIPYSVAASTRVEKLQYKEILTPKWREVEYDISKPEIKINGAVKNTSQDGDDMEDISDEAVLVRHDKSEHDEKKKFLSYLKLPLGYGRSRSHKRTDSRAESSGANTPDPMSPRGASIDQNESATSPLTSPPATPLSATTDDNSNLSGSNININNRRRTISQSQQRYCKEKDVPTNKNEEFRCNTPEQVVDVPPYEKRAFPLCDDTYQKMKKNMPENHTFASAPRELHLGEGALTTVDRDAKRDESHDSESTESAYGDEDPNDPEWIEMERVKDSRSKK